MVSTVVSKPLVTIHYRPNGYGLLQHAIFDFCIVIPKNNPPRRCRCMILFISQVSFSVWQRFIQLFIVVLYTEGGRKSNCSSKKCDRRFKTYFQSCGHAMPWNRIFSCHGCTFRTTHLLHARKKSLRVTLACNKFYSLPMTSIGSPSCHGQWIFSLKTCTHFYWFCNWMNPSSQSNSNGWKIRPNCAGIKIYQAIVLKRQLTDLFNVLSQDYG